MYINEILLMKVYNTLLEKRLNEAYEKVELMFV